MRNRISNRLIARFVAIAALLALVMAAPAVFAQENIDYPENGTDQVASFSATDVDGDPIVWSLSGPDVKLFAISADGVLSFKKSPNYEDPKDVGGDNAYNVTVSASGGSTDVVVNVTNEDEPGKVTLDDLQPQAGASVSVKTFSDPDGDTGETTWQWSKSMDQAAWTDIAGATSSTYTPKTGDVGYYLRATAEYSDGLGTDRDSASAKSAFAVERRPAANNQPSFADDNDEVDGNQQDRTVNETAKVGSSVGNAVTATDADNDPLLYTLDKVTVYIGPGTDNVQGTDDDVTTDVVVIDLGTEATPVLDTDTTDPPNDTTVDVTTLFTINNKTGQISVKSGADLDLLDIETYPNTYIVPVPIETDASPTKPLAYDVQVTATDPSGSTATVTVTIAVNEVNEAPGISRSGEAAPEGAEDRTSGGEFVVTTPEQVPLDLSGIASATAFEGLPVFDGKDPEGANDKITWSISGVDAKRFLIADIRAQNGDGYQADDDNAPDGTLDEAEETAWEALSPEARAADIAENLGMAALRWSTSDGKGPSFEAMDSADGDNVYLVTVTASDGSASKSQAVSITVINREEAGKVTLTQLVPQQGIAITARLRDQDGNITGTKWQWYRGSGTLSVDAKGNVVAVVLATDATLTPSGAVSIGVDADNNAETPDITVVQVVPAAETNGTYSVADIAGVTSATFVTHCELTDEDKAGPDGDIDTTDDNQDTPSSSICAINGATSSTYIPVAKDAGKMLQARATYVDAFTTDITPSADGDVAPTAGDGTDDGDAASVVADNAAGARPNENDLPDFGEDESVSRSVDENVKGASVGDPVTAIDDDVLLYTLSGDGSDDFEVSGGQITTAKKLDFETRSSYALTLTATDPSLASASITVNITVTDADDPATISAGSSVDYAENGDGPVQTFVLNDQDASSGGWSVSGRDAKLFKISSDGALSFKKSPNYEDSKDVGGDNTYNVTVRRSGGSLDVAVNVTNEDETGSVSLDDLQPQSGASVSVKKFTDPDGDPGETTWQWSKSMDQATWTDIAGATASTYTPKSGDVGYYLRATAEYSDGLGTERDSASAMTAFAVERRPAANSQPSFADDNDDVDGNQQDRMVKETAKVGSSVGNAVTATDADNDPLLYTLEKVTVVTGLGDDREIGGTDIPDGASNADITRDTVEVIIDLGEDDAVGGDADETVFVAVTDLFAIDPKTGQISVKGAKDTLKYLDIETYPTILVVTVTAVDDGDDTAVPMAEPLAYDVQVKATDPSGSFATVTVTIEVEEVNEAPDISRSDEDAPEGAEDRTTGGEFVVTTPEQVPLDLSGIASATAFEGLPVFEGEDPEGKNDKITWSLSGPDAKRFLIADIRPLDGDTTGGDPTGPDGKLSTAEEAAWEALEPEARAADIAENLGMAALRWSTSDGSGPSFEAMDSADGDNVYLVTVTASDGSASKSQAVSITVINREEAGKVTLTQLVPQQGLAITARLRDQDGNITGTKWQWYRGSGDLGVDARGNVVAVVLATTDAKLTPSGAVSSPVDHDGDGDGVAATPKITIIRAPHEDDVAVTSVTFVTHCELTDDDKAGPDGVLEDDTDTTEDEAVDNQTVASSPCKINGATSSTYIPVAKDEGEKLQARATYVDDFKTDIGLAATVTAAAISGATAEAPIAQGKSDGDDDGDAASAVSENAAELRPNENDLPDFGDDESVDRSVDENVKGASVGDPVTAIDDDVLQYELSGDGSDDFEVDNSGQITTAKGLDYETKSSYTITVTATDPSLASASITVNITVTDADDDATVILLTGNAPAFEEEEMTRSVAENTAAGTAIGGPVAATDEDGDALTYTLGGDDADAFDIDAATGQLMTSAALDYETKMSYTVTVSASSGKADEVDATTTVTISVSDEGLDNAYDLNEDGTIERDEVIAAIQDYLAGNIGRSDVTALIRLYFGNGG